jgi:hypothetical protein
VVLEFNHKDPRTKAANMADLIRFGWSTNRLFDEIAKCEVMCANRHQHFTSTERPNTTDEPEPSKMRDGAIKVLRLAG